MRNHLKKAVKLAVSFMAAGVVISPLNWAWAATNDSEFYQEMYNHLVRREENFTVNYSGSYSDIYSGNNFDNMVATVMNLHTDNNSDDFDYLRWNYKNISFTCANNDDNTSNFNFEVTYREPAERLTAVNQNVQSLLPNLQGGNDLQTIKNVHDFVVNQIEYDRTMQRYTAYEGLLQNSTVCQGYALLTYKLLTEAGIPCRIVAGYAGERHSWNIVKIGDKWYHLDCTWDDPISNQPILRYDYYLIGTDKISKDHVIDAEWLSASSMAQYPISTSDFDEQYIVQENQESMGEAVYQTVLDRESFHKALSTALDQAFAYEQQGKYKQRICDLYKRIVLSAVQDLTDEEFAKLTKDDNSMEQLFYLAEKHINNTIFNPLIDYVDGPDFAEAGEKKFIDFCSRNDVEQMDAVAWNSLSDKLASQWADEVMEEEIARISRENTIKVIAALRDDLQTITAAN